MEIWSFLILTFLTVFIVIDGWCYMVGHPTLSSKITEWTKKHPILPFVVGLIIGLLAGHWWWPLGSLPFSGAF